MELLKAGVDPLRTDSLLCGGRELCYLPCLISLLQGGFTQWEYLLLDQQKIPSHSFHCLTRWQQPLQAEGLQGLPQLSGKRRVIKSWTGEGEGMEQLISENEEKLN